MNRPWQETLYPPGVPAEINPDAYHSIAEIFQESVKKFSQNPSFISMGRELTYAQLGEKAEAFAAFLQQDLGLVKGDRLAIMVPNLLQYPIALFGAQMAGITVVNVNPLYTERELRHQLKDSGSKAILVFEVFAHTLEAVIEETPVEHVITTGVGDCLGLKGKLINFMVRTVKKAVPAFRLPGAIGFNEALARGARMTLSPVAISGEDTAFLQYTGGTTGVAKGAVLSQRNIIANMLQARAMIEPIMEEGKEMMVTALPLYHIYALTCNCLAFISSGGSNLLIANPRDLEGFVKTLSKYRFSFFTGVNTLFNGLMNTPGFDQLDFSGLKVTMAGGMATQRAVAEKWQQKTGCAVLEGFGLTECSPCVSVSPYTQEHFSGAIGVPLPSTDVRLVDENGKDVATSEPGELWVKGPQVMQGYYQRPEATAEILQDGWLATGDIATLDEDGLLRIVDRKKDMILVSGFNVFPNEIEEVVAMHESIATAGAIGVPCDQTGEKVRVYVEVHEGELDTEALIAHCRQHLTAYKVPREFEVMDELPKTPVGKVLRKDLRKLLIEA
ncbi:AMP-binding protein [Biformimicrobium ophioploci]|uniref:Long-chain-fatty-acid--CoA ligase n=1 Tax=Biformimicrobium ophioploci TaxID=3036711 RepID=A0ABQ6LX84_9GAMM|nr:AMP-binding protein [Microbulbifer sp. NKW57]GMG86695.1 long-chain-fatty-acid--CoA ligase FadD [Microbulbifer sp. NKW57]